MKILKLKTVNLHNGINLDIDLNENINLLVGINGCGKTSLLNTIDWLLKPNLQKLATVDYREISITFTTNKELYTLRSIKDTSKVQLSLHNSKFTPTPLIIDLIHTPRNSDIEEAEIYYGNLSPEKHEFDLWNFLKSLNTPTTITLDRTLTAESDDVIYFENAKNNKQRTLKKKTPLSRIKEVTALKYSEYRSAQIKNDEKLKLDIIMSALQTPDKIFDSPLTPMTPKDIKNLENKVTRYLSTAFKAEEIEPVVQTYFSSSKMLAKRTDISTSKDSYIINFLISQYRQIEILAKAFNDYETENSKAYKAIQDYLSAVNSFLNDSGKQIDFDDNSGRLVFKFIHENENRSIDYLSSGERQILILFTFIAFVAQKNGIFIVDEPELSLHPKWQYEFMESLLKVCPKNTQIIIASHSPDIVGKYKKYCIPVRGQKNAS